MRVTAQFRFGSAAAKEIGETFSIPIGPGRVETWRVVRERLDLQPFEGGQRIYDCEEVLPERFLREIGEKATP